MSAGLDALVALMSFAGQLDRERLVAQTTQVQAVKAAESPGAAAG